MVALSGPAPAQTRNPIEGRYDLVLFGHDSLTRPLALGRVLLVLTVAPIPTAVAARLHSVYMDARPAALDHGACWRSLLPALTFWSAHTQWREVGGIVTVTVWQSPDAGDVLRLFVRGNAVRGEVSRWRWNGKRAYDSIIGSRTGPGEPSQCSQQLPPN
jgi:hypothetical protein